MSAEQPGSRKVKRQAFLQQMLVELLEQLPADQQRAAWLATVPNWSDVQLLARLLGKTGPQPASAADLEAAQSAAEALIGQSLLKRDPFDRLLMPDDVRQALSASLAGRELELTGLDRRAAHQTSLDYFRQRAASASPVEAAVYEREVVYHQLALDEPAGLRLLDERFEAAVSAFQLEQAEALAEQADRLSPALSRTGQAWATYYHARLDLLLRTGDQGRTASEALLDVPGDRSLSALARWNLGQLYVAQDSWSKAIQIYKQALELLPPGSLALRARLLYALGQAYRDLAENSGGFPEEVHPQYGRLNQALTRLQHLPFLVYEALRHRWDFLPNWYFGTNYQDWIVAYLYTEASRWYRAAVQALEQAGGGPELTEANLALARIDHRLGRWSRAWGEYRRLESAPDVTASRYRLARVRLAEAVSLVEEGRHSQAKTALAGLSAVFADFKDQASLGALRLLSAQIEEKLGDLEAAALSYLEAHQSLTLTGDNLARTEVVGRLESLALRAGSALGVDVRRRISLAAALTEQYEYLARFPDQILHWFRRLALLAALPLSYILVLVAGLALVFALIIVEGSLRSVLVGANFSAVPFTDFLILVAGVILPVPFALWIYRFVYSLMGDLLVWRLGSRLAPIEKEQPEVIVTGPEGLERRRSGEEQPARLPWEAVQRVAGVDYQLWQRPIQLVSRTLVNPGQAAWVINGITAGYPQLQGELGRRLLAHQKTVERLGFTYLTRGWLIAATLLTLGFTFLLRKLDISGGINVELPLTFSTLALKFVTIMWLVFPTGVLLRLIRHRRMVEKTLGYQPEAVPTWVLAAAAGFFIVALAGLVLLVILVASA
jgi:hypothetical protein